LRVPAPAGTRKNQRLHVFTELSVVIICYVVRSNRLKGYPHGVTGFIQFIVGSFVQSGTGYQVGSCHQGTASLSVCILEYTHGKCAVFDSLTSVYSCVYTNDRYCGRVNSCSVQSFDCSQSHSVVVGDDTVIFCGCQQRRNHILSCCTVKVCCQRSGCFCCVDTVVLQCLQTGFCTVGGRNVTDGTIQQNVLDIGFAFCFEVLCQPFTLVFTGLHLIRSNVYCVLIQYAGVYRRSVYEHHFHITGCFDNLGSCLRVYHVDNDCLLAGI